MACSSEKPKDCEVADGESWQSNKSVTECNRHMLEHGIATDVTFLVSCDSDQKVEASRFSAHKYVLISRSPVFYSMLCGDLAETGEITVTDVEPGAFRQMLNYIYTGDLDLTPDLVMFILYASKKYMIPGLTKKCTDYLQDKIDASNACIILDQSLIFDEKELAERCMKLIKYKTNAALNADSFIGIRQNVLSKILDSSRFTIKEVDVFKACLRWADGKCKEQNIETTGKNRKMVLGECFNKLRYADIEIGEFVTVVSLSEILTKEEEIGMLRHLGNKVSIQAPAGFCFDSRFLPGPYEIISTENLQQVSFGTTTFELTVVSDSDVKVNKFVIGTWLPVVYSYGSYNQPLSSITALSSVIYNGVNVPGSVTRELDAQKQEWKCNSQLIIKAGETKLQMAYANSHGNGAHVHVPPKNEIVLSDDHIQMKLTSQQQWMPILGLEYELV